MKPQCETCRYWELDHAYEGLCRRHAPTVLVGHSGDTGGTQWPYTDSWDWCGEYEPAEGELPTQVSGGE